MWADFPSGLSYSSFALLIVAPDKKEKNLTDGQGYFSRTSVRFSTFLSKLHIMIVVFLLTALPAGDTADPSPPADTQDAHSLHPGHCSLSKPVPPDGLAVV